jgi:hypothetical protein
VTVKPPATSHEVRLSKIEGVASEWRDKSNEQPMKVRLKKLLGLC